MDKKVGQSALQVDGGAIGVSSWLLTPELNPDTNSGTIVSLNLGRGLKITIEILSSQPKKLKTVSDNNSNDSRLKISELSEASLNSSKIKDFNADLCESDSDFDLNPENFQLRVNLTGRHNQELKCAKMKLEEMINLSVFHLHGFNHYVTQFGVNGGFDLIINSHSLGIGLFEEELSRDGIILKSLDFAE